ncbi:MAG TPA: TonB family protein [Bryobacteraceae bacterium]|jgi:TonB family protein|nr:TonB family protein [Bryobacteraceae bacterium]
MSSGADSGPNFELDWHEFGDSRRHWRAGIGSFVVHCAIFALVIVLGSLSGPTPKVATEIYIDFTKATPLILPSDITQKAPNKAKLAKELNVEDLKPRPPSLQRLPPAPAVRRFKPPNPAPPGPAQTAAAPRIAEPPKIETQVAQNTPPALPAMSGTPKAPPPPQIQPVEQPKLAFETPGQNGPSENKGQAKIAPPKTDVQDVVRDLAHGAGGQGRLIIGDPPELPESIHVPQQPGRLGSSLELLSDPMGADFGPYLTQILALVKKNWFAVWPESARLGNRGTVQLMFSIDRTGQVPKLVIATPSGSQALDRAAVAGISATVPFPPLPNEFKGQQIRLQLSFKYNVQ